MKVSEVLETYNVGLSEDAVADMLLRALADAPPLGGPGLPEADQRFLLSHSGVRPLESEDHPEVLSSLSSIANAYPTAYLADLWGISPSRVRHRVSEGGLYALRAGRSLLFPRWQFGPDLRPLPHLTRVLVELPDDLHPSEMGGWFTTDNGNLVLDGRPTSVRSWLLSGGDVDPVLELARSIDRW